MWWFIGAGVLLILLILALVMLEAAAWDGLGFFGDEDDGNYPGS